MVKTRTVEMQTQLVGYEFKKKGLPTDKNIAVENSKVSNDYFWKTNRHPSRRSPRSAPQKPSRRPASPRRARNAPPLGGRCSAPIRR